MGGGNKRRYTSSSQPNYTALGCFALFSKESILTFEVVQFSETLVGESGGCERGEYRSSVKHFSYFKLIHVKTNQQTLSLAPCVISKYRTVTV